MIDKDNLKKNESIGTFRWNDSIKLINIPRKLMIRPYQLLDDISV
jgi:hypothetical protein